MELGRDSDTGGQVKYVVELARALGSMPGVYRVDLLTRQVSSPDVDWSYGEPTEMLTPRDSEDYSDEMGESSGAYIVRIPFGPKDKYIPKELLWPHIAEFVDGAMNHIMQMSSVLGEQVGGGKPIWPSAIHGHYADAGDAAALLSGALNVPMILTGHSLGRDKLEQLLKQGRLSKEEINSTYKIMRRIEGEELSLDVSEMVITSTRQEIDEQWRLYDGFDPILERKLRARIKRNVSCYGRFMPRMVILVLRIRRPWLPKKNITTLVKAFGECRPLRDLANLALIMGNRDGIDEMSSTSSSVLLSVLKLIDKYDLYGQVAYPKHHKQSDVPDIYRLAAKSKGVFINPAFIEPFGLTLIEAAAHGLPMVATKNGGPVDIHRVLDNGLLVDPHDQQSISEALLKLVADKQLWAKCRQNGLKNIHQFSWPEHCKTYLSRITSFKPRHPQWQSDDTGDNSEPESPSDSLRDIQDISLNLRFSFDGGSGNDGSMNQEVSSMDRKSKIEAAVLNWSKGKDSRKMGSLEKSEVNSGKFPAVRRRKFIVVIALDFDGERDTLEATRRILEAVEKERAEGTVGFILSTSLTISEIQSFLVSGGLNPNDFDAFVCNSGSDLYYTSVNSEDGPFVVDFYYHSHVEYRWGGEGLRKTLIRWASSVNEKKSENDEQIVTLAEHLSTDYCYTFAVKKPAADAVNPGNAARWPFFFFLGGSMFCLLSSSICHLFCCHSHNLNIFLLRIDYAGITAMIITSFFPPIYYIFQCTPRWYFIYLAAITSMGIFTIITLFTPSLSSPKYRGFRALLFASMGLFGIVPAIHALVVNWGNPQRNVTLLYELGVAVFYLVGTGFFVGRVPERLKPGWFDRVGHSHQIFHVFVLLGALSHYAAALLFLDWRDHVGC
ncbi:hypothetical protein F2Q69_00044440 [Brassica cretica]|uniref:sucrose-phosphate synthase n=2 Tax=Brassica TaxID=3705 RepID=A0A8S9NB55_BRACR|nr:hypothetical protein F2Q69_00044440 [Brassica cretica]